MKNRKLFEENSKKHLWWTIPLILISVFFIYANVYDHFIKAEKVDFLLFSKEVALYVILFIASAFITLIYLLNKVVVTENEIIERVLFKKKVFNIDQFTYEKSVGMVSFYHHVRVFNKTEEIFINVNNYKEFSVAVIKARRKKQIESQLGQEDNQ